MHTLLHTLLSEENKYIELKEQYSRTLLKTISAFANYHNGKIIIGVSDSGLVVGVEKLQDLRLNIENAINDNIKPRPYIEIESKIVENKAILILSVFKGDITPYTLNNKAYCRIDTSTVEVEKHAYDELVLLGRNQTYEELNYNSDELRFRKLEEKLHDIINIQTINNDILKSLSLIKNNSYNNAAALLSDFNKFNDLGFDFICFQDNSLMVIKDSIRLSGVSILDHFDKGMLFYLKHINKGDIIKSAIRKSYEEIPEVAYREALSNAIIHRDYSRRGNNRIEIFEDRIEIVSIGSLSVGISEKEFINGSFSNIRNQIIADVFLRCNMIEKFGTGILRIKQAYAKYDVKPTFKAMKNSITIILPKIKLIETKNSYDSIQIELTATEDKVLNFIKSTNDVSRTEIEKYLDVKKTKATKILSNLLEYDMITKIGIGRNTKYRANITSRT